MAIDVVDLPLFFHLADGCAFRGRLLTLGRQDVTVSVPELRAAAAQFRFPLAAGLPKGQALSDQALFRALGFESVQSLDADGYEGAAIIHDLNDPEPPPGTDGRFDVVLDRGVSDVVFDLASCLSCVARMVKVGGRAIHFLPSSNHVEMGYVMPSPRALQAFYQANRFAIEALWLVRLPWLDRWPTVTAYEYRGALAESLRGVRLDDSSYQIFAVVRRLAESTWDVMPAFGRDNGPAGGSARRDLSEIARPILRFTRPVTGDDA